MNIKTKKERKLLKLFLIFIFTFSIIELTFASSGDYIGEDIKLGFDINKTEEEINKLGLMCNFYRSVDSYDLVIKYLNNGKDLFEYNKDINEKKYKFNGIEYTLPNDLLNKNIKYNISKINDTETIEVFFDDEYTFILENNKFIKYEILDIEYTGINDKNNNSYEIYLLKKGENFYLDLVGFNARFLKQIYINDSNGLEFDDFVVSDDSKHFLITMKKSNDKYVVIKDGEQSKEYLSIQGLSFMKNSSDFGFYAATSIDEEKMEVKINFIMNFENKIELLAISKDGDNYYKVGDELFKIGGGFSRESSFTINILKGGTYYYGITKDGTFKLYEGDKLLINEKAYYFKNLTSEDDKYLAINIYNGAGERIIFSNSYGYFKKIYTFNSDNYSFDNIESISLESIEFINNKLFYFLEIFENQYKDGKYLDSKHYEIITDNLDLNELPKLEYKYISKASDFLETNDNIYYGKIIDSNNLVFFDEIGKKSDIFIGRTFSGKILLNDVELLGVTSNLDIIRSEKNNNYGYNIYENDKILFNVGDLKDVRVIFSNDYSKYHIEYYDENKNSQMVYFNGKSIHFFSNIKYSNDLKNIYFHIYAGSQSRDYTCNIKSKLQLLKQGVISKKELNKTSKGKNYISTIDLFINNTSDKTLEKLATRLSKFDTSLQKLNKYKDLLNYLEAKVGFELNRRNNNLY